MISSRTAANALDTFSDVIGFLYDINSSFTDVVVSCGDAIAKPPKWCRRRAEKEPTYIGEGVWSSVRLEGQGGARTIKRYDWTYNALRMYRPYRILEAERRTAKCDDKQRQTISFLDLPGEIRTKIYKLALVFDAIETEARICSRSHTVSCDGLFFDHKEHWCPWCYSHYRTWQTTVRPALGLLRLNKQINAEAASVFYGHNEFRFTNPNGRDTLEAFCKTIGEANTRRLAKITHHVTFDNRVDHCSCMSNPKLVRRSKISQKCHRILPVWLCKSNTSESKIPQERWKDLPVWLKWRGMHMQGTTSSPAFDFASALAMNGGLREYRLVLPHDWRIRREHIARHLCRVFDHVGRPHPMVGIKTTLVLLDPGYRNLDRVIRTASVALTVEYRLRCDCVKIALQLGWEVVMANSVDPETGNYEYSAPLHSVDEFISKVKYESSRAPHKYM